MSETRSFLVPVGGVDPSSQRTNLPAALYTSNNIYENATHQVDDLITSKASIQSKANATGAARTLPASVDVKVASETNFNDSFKAMINNPNNSNSTISSNKSSNSNSNLVPRLVNIAKRAALLGGEESELTDDNLGSGKLNNSIIQDYITNNNSSTSTKTAVDTILTNYLQNNTPKVDKSNEETNDEPVVVDEVEESSDSTNDEPKLPNEESNLSIGLIVSIIVVLIFIILIIFFSDIIKLTIADRTGRTQLITYN